MTEDEVEALDDVGMLAFLRPFGLPAGLESQILATMNMLFVVPVDRLAASEGVLVLRQVVLGGAGRFHAGGYGQVAEACAAVRRRPRRCVRPVHPGRRDRRRGRPGRPACGAGTVSCGAPVVVSNAGIQPTVLKLVGAAALPRRVRGHGRGSGAELEHRRPALRPRRAGVRRRPDARSSPTRAGSTRSASPPWRPASGPTFPSSRSTWPASSTRRWWPSPVTRWPTSRCSCPPTRPRPWPTRPCGAPASWCPTCGPTSSGTPCGPSRTGPARSRA